jgi:hypothetical protein
MSNIGADMAAINSIMERNQVKYTFLFSNRQIGTFIVLSQFNSDSMYKNHQDAMNLSGSTYDAAMKSISKNVEKLKKKFPDADKKPYDKSVLEKNEANADKPLKISAKLPADLKNEELLVMIKPGEEKKFNEIYSAYPYKYKLITYEERFKVKELKNKYLVWPESEMIKSTETNWGTGQRNTNYAYHTIAYIMDIQTEAIYYDPAMKGAMTMNAAHKELVKLAAEKVSK